MSQIDKLRRLFENPPYLSPVEQEAFERINAQCIGYSTRKHYVFFRTLLANFPIKNMLILGVYYGRDVGYFCEIARQLDRKDFRITGVDKFTDDSCADWPKEHQAMNWRQAGFGQAPELEKAQANLRAMGCENAELVKTDDASFMATTRQRYDLIYIDTSHDEKTVKRQIIAAADIINDSGLIGGDDYNDYAPTWGVIKAVNDCCVDHVDYYNWLWITDAALVRKTSAAA